MTSINSSNDPYIGLIVAKRFQIKHLIGQGAMGSVYYAEDIVQKEKFFAIKFLQTLIDESLRRRFAREASIGAQLGKKSSNIVQVMAYGIHEDKIPFYVMEFVRGASLENIIGKNPIPVDRCLRICRQICLALQAAHQGVQIKETIYPVVHRDLKPANILITTDPKLGEVVKILDFGIAKLMGEQAKLTGTYDFLGTMIYSSPEQMEGRKLDNRSDIYSLGILMFEMLTGKLPWDADTSNSNYGAWYKLHHFQTPRSLKEALPSLKVPAELENLVIKCLAKEPSDRPQSIDEVLKALEAIPQSLEAIPQETATESRFPRETEFPELVRSASWPKNKPIAEIVFTHPINTSEKPLPAVWVMLPSQQIKTIQQDLATPDNHRFLNVMSPHPTLLWITLLYSQHHSPRWLPCFLDLKTKQGQTMARLLAATGFYAVLFFALEEPQRVAHVMKFVIEPSVLESLKSWSEKAQTVSSSAPPEESKKLLKAELEKIKPQMLTKLAAQGDPP